MKSGVGDVIRSEVQSPHASSGKARKASKTLSHSVATAVNAVVEPLSDVIETLGNAVEDGLNPVARAAEHIPLAGPAFNQALRWAGRVTSAVSDLTGALLKGAGGLLAGVVGGLLQALVGILSLDRHLVWDGLLDVASGIAGAFVVSVGKAIALVQTVVPFEAPERPLTGDEMAMLRRVFHESIALYNVRLVEGRAGIFGLNDRPFTLCNTIYLKKRDVSKEPQLLVHECTHVWQYQHLGSSYASKAIGAQWFVDDAYNWKKEISRGNHEWHGFNREAQAAFLEELYRYGQLIVLSYEGASTVTGSISGRGGGVFCDNDGHSTIGRFEVNGIDHTDRANDALAAVRHAVNFRPSKTLCSGGSWLKA